ncbi:cache domain methyl-accepting chemotaxis signaling domain multi-domain-containing protein [Babesia caballi]|uniref:Cache domain methyl-accepting chemotaxis signaling domain multi-domain-containing protein n=1 Tax=Babesia caballi TaxID=5871 RepID=A0AAV4M063_BABCB|nr:cache domain methyl-accepting chemotaxis signaling domain multi-domain-containing protein [Babesia caballi]
MTRETSGKPSLSKDNIKSAAMVAGGYLLFSAAVWSVFANPRRHEWVDVLMDYCNHRRSQYSGVWAKFARRH